MEFTYKAYANLLMMIKDGCYCIAGYDDRNYDLNAKSVILRHDIDFSLEKALTIARLERDMGVESTFFLLLTGGFYNLFSKRSQKIIHSIIVCGHSIGLHFDETRYPESMGKPSEIQEKIIEEVDILQKVIGLPVKVVSMHRPSQAILESNLSIPNITNAYATRFFKDYKYVSDSRRRWREPVEEYIREKTYDKLQILVHPFWYNKDEIDIVDSIRDFVNQASFERYDELLDNITDLKEIMKKGDMQT